MQFPCGVQLIHIKQFIFNILILTSPAMRISRHKRTNTCLITGPGWAVQVRIPDPKRRQEFFFAIYSIPHLSKSKCGYHGAYQISTKKYLGSKSLFENCEFWILLTFFAGKRMICQFHDFLKSIFWPNCASSWKFYFKHRFAKNLRH